MDFLTIDFGSDPQKRLAPVGLKLETFSGPLELTIDSSFEPPMFLQAAVENRTFLEIGAFSSISGGRISGVSMGRYCAIAPDVILGAHEHPKDWLTCSRVAHYPVVHGWDKFCRSDAVDFIRNHTHHFAASHPTTRLGHDVWIGQGAFIRAGVQLGTGCIVGARSVVTKDVPPYAVVSGMPAKVKRYRFAEAVIERLLTLEWWRYSLYDCFQVPFERIEDAIGQLEDLVGAGTLTPYSPHRFFATHLHAMFGEPQQRDTVAGRRS